MLHASSLRIAISLAIHGVSFIPNACTIQQILSQKWWVVFPPREHYQQRNKYGDIFRCRWMPKPLICVLLQVLEPHCSVLSHLVMLSRNSFILNNDHLKYIFPISCCWDNVKEDNHKMKSLTWSLLYKKRFIDERDNFLLHQSVANPEQTDCQWQVAHWITYLFYCSSSSSSESTFLDEPHRSTNGLLPLPLLYWLYIAPRLVSCTMVIGAGISIFFGALAHQDEPVVFSPLPFVFASFKCISLLQTIQSFII